MLCSYYTGYLYDVSNWWRRSPLGLFENRFKDFPIGIDIAKGKPEDL